MLHFSGETFPAFFNMSTQSGVQSGCGAGRGYEALRVHVTTTSVTIRIHVRISFERLVFGRNQMVFKLFFMIRKSETEH